MEVYDLHICISILFPFLSVSLNENMRVVHICFLYFFYIRYEFVNVQSARLAQYTE